MIFDKQQKVLLEDPDESIVELTEKEDYKDAKRSALHNLKTVSWLRKRKKKPKRGVIKYVDPGKNPWRNSLFIVY